MDPVWKPFCCGECGKKFTSMEILKKHLKQEHPIDEKQKLIDELMKMNNNLETQNIAFEMEVKASHKIIERMREENEKLQKGKNVAEKVIKNLQDTLNLQSKEIVQFKKITKEKEKLTLEKETLEQEVVEIKKENISKEENLNILKMEIKSLEGELSKYKEKKVDDKNVQTDAAKVGVKNVQTDAMYSEEFKSAKTFECDVCHHKLNSMSDLKMHKREVHGLAEKRFLESQLQNMKFQFSSEALKLSFKLALLKEKEMKDNSDCHCRSFCRIFHPKHNWKRSKSVELGQHLKDLQSRLL